MTSADSFPAEQQKWNSRYGDRSVENASCSHVLAENSHLLPRQGRALDLACGLGGASIHLARRGLDVVAWDISSVAVGKLRAFAQLHGLPIAAEVVDVTELAMKAGSFDVIHVSRFLDRRLCAALSGALRDEGLLFYQAFSIEALDTATPMNPDYCLVRGELLGLFHELRPVVYREDARLGDSASGFRNEALLVAQKPRATPRFLADWRRRIEQCDDPAALSRAIATHRRRVAALPDRLGGLATGDVAAREKEWGLIENAEVVIVPDSCVPQLRVLMLTKVHHVLPTDLPEAAQRRLGYVVDSICNAFRRVTGTVECRCWVPHPDQCKTGRLHLFVDPDLPELDAVKKQAVWGEISADIRQALAAMPE